MKQLLFIVLCGLAGSALFAEDLKPPMPLPAGDSSDLLPPPMDLSQMTPLPLPDSPKAEPAKKDTSVSPAPQSADKNAQNAAALKALNDSQPAANSKALVPTAVPIKSEKKNAAAPTPTPIVEAPPAPPAEKPAVDAPVASLGLFAEYFPTAKGAKWTYEYLKADAGSTTKKIRTVECTEQTQTTNGAVQATLETTEDGQSAKDVYSLLNNQVEHTASGDQSLTGDFIFKLPPPGGSSSWSVTEKNETIHKSKASFGKAQVYKKTYPDCVIVTEKVLKGGKSANTVFYYYAKGIGLVAVEVYSPAMKLLLTKSIALTSGPGKSAQ